MQNFIDEEKISGLLEQQPKNVDNILKKARELKGLALSEAAELINITEDADLEMLFGTANFIKNEIYGNRLVLFAPLYISNHCSNNCLYCGFRKDNSDMERKALSIEEIKDETRSILEQGHKRILMLMGESENCSFEFFLNAIKAAYSVRDSKGNSIRRINLEIAPLTGQQFRKLEGAGIGTYTVFQETYHRETYRMMHPIGRKADYDWRLHAMDRAIENGLKDVGIGALFGLNDYRFEVLGLLSHAVYLDSSYGIGPHTISVPRINPAQNAPKSRDIPSPVNDRDFMKIVAVLRCAVPYTGIILSTRESPDMRTRLFDLGVSQISAGSRTNLMGYTKGDHDGQFSLTDTRPVGSVIASVIRQGYIPSFCTGCYRLGRVGSDFMELAKPGLIRQHCLPNALTTLKEYLVDYADDETRKAGDSLIQKELGNIEDLERRHKTMEFLEMIEKGDRDLYF